MTQETKVVVLNKKFADWYLGLEPLDGERQVRQEHVDWLMDEVAAGRFDPEDVRLKVFEFGGKEYRGNGQHTCTMVQQADGEFPSMKVRLTVYHVADAAEAARRYSIIDDPRSGRSYTHILDVVARNSGIYKLGDSQKAAMLFASAVAFEKGNRTEAGKNKATRQDKIGYLLQHAANYRKWYNLLTNHGQVCRTKASKHLWREPVACAIYQTLLVDGPAAFEFWGLVREGANVIANSPALILRNYLIDTGVSYGRGAMRTYQAGFCEMYAKCIHAWNAWRRGETTALKVYKKAGLPKAS